MKFLKRIIGFLAVTPDRSVKTYLDFGAQGATHAAFKIEPQNNGCRVTSGFEAEFGYDLVGRYFGLMFDRWIGADYEKGLANLKALVESK